MEPGLHNVNIHTFGYNSDWASTKSSILNVHDFGQSLLEEMRNSPHYETTVMWVSIYRGYCPKVHNKLGANHIAWTLYGWSCDQKGKSYARLQIVQTLSDIQALQ